MIRLGFALTGSFCTFDAVLPIIGRIARDAAVTPIMSDFAGKTDTRFGSSGDFIGKLEELCGRPVIKTIAQAEPVGPQKLFDIIVVAPCTGNTLAKLAHGITDSTVTMAVKAHLRNSRPVVLAVSTNDALGANAVNIGSLINRKNIYFVPFGQDDPAEKPTSLVADMEKLPETVAAALNGSQLQPVIIAY